MFASTAEVGTQPTDGVQRPLELIERELTELCGHLNVATCRWHELLAEFDRRDGWMGWDGCRSCADWLAWRCALTPRAAREHVRVARRIEGLPAVHEAFARGELSFSKVRAITRIATAESEQDLLELARHATAAQLERMIRAARRVTAQEACEAHERAYCVWGWQDDGSLRIRAELPAEDGAAFIAAVDAARDELNKLRREEARATAERKAAETALRGSAEPLGELDRTGDFDATGRPRWATRGECLALVAETALEHVGAGSAPPARRQVVLHARADFEDVGPLHLHDGPSVSLPTARRLACDAAIVGVREDDDGSVLSVGRRTRSPLGRRWRDLAHEPGALMPAPPPARSRGRLSGQDRRWGRAVVRHASRHGARGCSAVAPPARSFATETQAGLDGNRRAHGPGGVRGRGAGRRLKLHRQRAGRRSRPRRRRLSARRGRSPRLPASCAST